jgi:dihydroflavonol-4-reductase
VLHVRVLVTGGTGFIGSHVTRALLAAGHGVRLLVRDPARVDDPGAVEVVQGDILDAAAVDAAVSGCDAVVHAAAVVAISGDRAAEATRTNEQGTRHVLGSAVAHGLDPVVHLSSMSALFRPGGVVLMQADDPVTAARTPYSASKAASERYARELQAGGAPVVCIYPGGVLGPGDPGLSEAMRGALIWRRLTMVALDTGFLLVDVRDVADMVVAALRPGQGPQRLLAGHFYLPWRQLCDLVTEVTGRPVVRLPMTGAVLRAAGRLGDLARRAVAFEFPLGLEAMTTAAAMVPMDDLRTAADLGLSFRPPAETLRDAYAWLYDSGRLPARWVPALAAQQEARDV